MNFSPRRPVQRSTGALERLIGAVQRSPRTTLLVAGLLAIFSLAFASATLKFKTSRDDLVDASEAYIKNWKNVQEEFGGEEDVIVAVASGAGEPRLERLAAAIETIARDIETFPQLFRNLRFRIDTEKLRAKGLYQLPLADVRRIEQRIDPLRPLLIGTWNWLTLDNVLHSTRFRLDNLPVGQPMEEHQRETFQNAIRILDSLAAFLANEHVYQSPWPTVLELPQQGSALSSRYFFAPNGRIGFLRVEVVRDHASFVGAGQTLDALQKIVQRTNTAFPDLEIGLTGLPVLENDEMQAAQADSSYSTILSIVGVSLLFFAAFRSLWRPLYAILALLVGSAWTMGWVALTVGHLNILSVSFIVTLIGLGIDYGILWLSRFEGELDRGADSWTANLATARDVGPGIIVGAVTTALAFWMTMLTGFLGLREMGWIAGSGVILCLIAAFTVLPALLALQRQTAVPKRRRSPQDSVMAPFLAQRPIVVATALIAATAVLSAWIPRVHFDYNLLNLQAAGMKSVEWEKRLINDSGASAWYALSTADTRDEAVQLRQRFEQLPSVGRVVEFASLIPDDQAEKRPLIRELHNLLQPLPAPDQLPQRTLPRVERLIEQCHELASDGQRFRNRPADETALIAQMSAAARRAELAIRQIAPIACGRQIAKYERRWVEDLVGQLQQLRGAVANPDPVTIADLPPALLAGYHSANGRWLVQVFAKSNVWDIDPLKEFARQVASVDPNISGKPISTLHALVAMTDGYWQSAWLAAIVIALAVWFDFRNLGHTLLALLPLAVGCIASMGTMGVCGISFNPANMIALPLVLGIGIDYGVHVLHDYRNSLAAGASGYRMTWRLGRALFLTSSTTLLSFAALIVARHQGMHSIGLVLAIGVGWCTVAAMFLLPAVLQWMEQRAEQQVSIPMPLSDNIYSKSA